MRRHSNYGFSLIEVMVSIGILTVLSGVAWSLIANLSSLKSANTSRVAIEETRLGIIAALNNEASWTATLNSPNNGAAFQCLALGQTVNSASYNCSGVGGSELLIYQGTTGNPRLRTVSRDDVSTIFTPETSGESTIGFNSVGTPCYGFSAAGNDNCPFKYVATWTPVCPIEQNISGGAAVATDACRNPIIDIAVVLKFFPANPQKFPNMNLDHFKIHVAKSQVSSNMAILCGMMGLTFTQTNPTIPNVGTCAPTNSYCPNQCGGSATTYVVGLNWDATPTCECSDTAAAARAAAFQPIPGYVLLGIDSSANPIWSLGLQGLFVQNGVINNPAFWGHGS